MNRKRVPTVLSIAGSDSGGGAGIQADLKAFAACGVHGTTAITAITAQNTIGVDAVEAISPAMIVSQVRAVAKDIGVDAVKIGMLGTAETAEAVIEAVELVGEAPIVVDPVMVAESGAVLLDDEARTVLVERLLPRATVVTPNIPEARALVGAGEQDSQEDLAREVLALGPAAVVVTGGHSERVVDLFFDGAEAAAIEGERHPGGRRARLRLHPLLGFGRVSRPRGDSAGSGAAGQGDRVGRGRGRARGHRCGTGPRRRTRPDK